MILAFEDAGVEQTSRAADGVGLVGDGDGRCSFPAVEGGAGNPTGTPGGLNGWTLTATAPNEAAGFLRRYTAPEQPCQVAQVPGLIPVAVGAEDGTVDLLGREPATAPARAQRHWSHLDQDLGRAFKDVALEPLGGQHHLEEAAPCPSSICTRGLASRFDGGSSQGPIEGVRTMVRPIATHWRCSPKSREGLRSRGESSFGIRAASPCAGRSRPWARARAQG